ncbi:MAG: hypothetical protein AABZ39_03310 [Spirochaetota bacterium]
MKRYIMPDRAVVVLAVLVSAAFAFCSDAAAVFVKVHPEGPSLIVSAGDYKMRFAQKTGWTFRETSYRGKCIFVPSGFMQPVLNEKVVPKGIDPFLGTGHRPEEVDAIDCIVSNNGMAAVHPVQEGLRIEGDAFTIRKKSRFVSAISGFLYSHESRVTISPSGIHEEYSFTAASDGCSNVNYMYMFMHIFTNTTRAWIVLDDKGAYVRGEFGDDNSFSLRKNIRYALVHDPIENIGIALVYPRVYEGRAGFWNSFWNRTYDNKLYLQIDPARTPGASFSYEIDVRAFDAPAETWEAAGSNVVSAMLGEKVLSAAKADAPASFRFSFDTAEGMKLGTGESIAKDAFKGAGCLMLAGDGSYKYKKFPLTLVPGVRYSISGAIKKGVGASAVPTHAMVSVMNYTPNNVLETFGRIGDTAPCDGQWHAYNSTFTASTNLTERAGLVLYNVNSKDSVCFDEIVIQQE